ncbi:MAG: hypothetical protein ACRCSL_16800 [Microbacterium sp.]
MTGCKNTTMHHYLDEVRPVRGKPQDRPVAHREDYEIVECGRDERRAAHDLVRAHHYAKSSSHRSFGFCAKRNGVVVGAALFLPPLPPAAKKHAKSDPKKVTSLSRLVVAPGEPQNVAGMLIAASLRQLRRDRRYDTVITYADLSQGHKGTVYKATNAIPCGQSAPEPYWIDPKTNRRVSRKATRSRTVAEMRALGYERCVSPGKFCFKWFL